MTIAGIVLCGGKSSRMGTSKAMLPFGDETMLERVLGRVLEVLPHVVVVAAANQTLPALPTAATLIHDEADAQGPLEGLRVGLQHLPTEFEAAFVCSCDLPGLVPAAIEYLTRKLDEETDIVVTRDGEFHHPLFAVYRRSIVPAIEQLLAEQRRRPKFLFTARPTKEIDVAELRGVDPNLTSFANVNTPEAYEAAKKNLLR